MSSKTIVLVTGANGGIGFESAAALIASSATYHVIIGSRSLSKGQTALSELQSRKSPGSLSLLQLDVTDTDSIAKAAETVGREFGRLDVLINNAGICSADPLQVGQLRETLETNTLGPAAVTEAFKLLLFKSENARLIYVSSVLGSLTRSRGGEAFGPTPYIAYRISKAALNMLAVSQHFEFEGKIKVWAFCPGYVVTNLAGDAVKQDKIKGGIAGSPEVSANSLLSIVEGKRDEEVGGFVHKDGVYPW